MVNPLCYPHIFYAKVRKRFNGIKSEPKQVFPDALDEINDFTVFLKGLKCPRCEGKEVLHLNTYERGRTGWEATVWCNCGVHAVLNDTGFHFKRLSPSTVKTHEARTKK